MNKKPTFERFGTFEELKGVKKPNQALQYDSGKYYYIEDCPKKPCKDKCESSSYCLDNCEKEYAWDDKIKSTRIEVAPESEDVAYDLLMPHLLSIRKKIAKETGTGESMVASYGLDLGEAELKIFPVQVKVETVWRAEGLTDEQFQSPENQNRDNPIQGYKKKYAILSEPDKDLSVSEGFEPKNDLPDTEKITKAILGHLFANGEIDRVVLNHFTEAQKEYGRQMLASLRKEIEKEIESKLPLNWDYHKEAYVNGLKRTLGLLDTITPQEMTKEELKQRFEKEIGTPNDYFNHRGGLMNEVFDWFWSEIESRDNRIKELEEQVKSQPCTVFHPDPSSSSATKCIHCGKEKYKHLM